MQNQHGADVRDLEATSLFRLAGKTQLTSTARSGTAGSAPYVERQFSAAIDTCRDLMSDVPCED